MLDLVAPSRKKHGKQQADGSCADDCDVVSLQFRCHSAVILDHRSVEPKLASLDLLRINIPVLSCITTVSQQSCRVGFSTDHIFGEKQAIVAIIAYIDKDKNRYRWKYTMQAKGPLVTPALVSKRQ